MTAADFGIIRELAYQHTGIVLPERKRHMVYSRLSRRRRLLRLGNFGEYCLKLQGDPRERAPFVTALRTNRSEGGRVGEGGSSAWLSWR
ncbi:hypothetical protein [Shewanella sp.]|uniref:hypothetical protein n=1 Tax=Shewanella sp. TaxID=50422 RepID=UPI000EBD370E|nr:hypothetical protein [Shewanella sp.]HCD13562.1 hypothetical protein [Shewanella sp.]